jgi:hypothetical protein
MISLPHLFKCLPALLLLDFDLLLIAAHDLWIVLIGGKLAGNGPNPLPGPRFIKDSIY